MKPFTINIIKISMDSTLEQIIEYLWNKNLRKTFSFFFSSPNLACAWLDFNFIFIFLLAKLTYIWLLSVSPSVRRSQNLVRTTPPKRLDGLSWNLQGIFLKVSSCAPDKNFYRQSVSKSVSHQIKKICLDNSS